MRDSGGNGRTAPQRDQAAPTADCFRSRCRFVCSHARVHSAGGRRATVSHAARAAVPFVVAQHAAPTRHAALADIKSRFRIWYLTIRLFRASARLAMELHSSLSWLALALTPGLASRLS